jgi:hypothetical protein
MSATISALGAAGETGGSGPSPAAAVADWVEAHSFQLERASKLLAALDRDSPEPLTVAALVLRRLR